MESYVSHIEFAQLAAIMTTGAFLHKKRKEVKMKKHADPRHQARIKTMKSLFSFAFQPVKNTGISRIVKHLPYIDAIIAKSAPEFPVEKIAKVDLAILRLAIYELLIEKRNPPKVIIDEAIELAKEFGGDSASAFVNGVLGTVLQKEFAYGRESL